MSDGATVNIVIAVIGFLTLWLKLKYGVEKGQEVAISKTNEVAKKVDTNTLITRAGNEAAAVAASAAGIAAEKAEVAAQKADDVRDQLNGKLEEKIRTIVRSYTDPILVLMRSHVEQDDKNMAEVRTALGELRDRTKRVDS